MRTAKDPSSNSSKNKYGPLYSSDKPLVLTLPVYGELMVVNGWTAAAAQRGDPTSVSLSFKRRPGISHFSIYEVREEFLEIANMNDAQKFFGRYGRLDAGPNVDVEYEIKQITGLQQEIRSTREMPALEYFRAEDNDWKHFFEAFPVMGKLVLARAPSLYVEAEHVLEAVRCATYLDQIAGVRAAACKQCGNQFSWGPRDKRRTFCTTTHQAAYNKDLWNKKFAKGKYAKAAK